METVSPRITTSYLRTDIVSKSQKPLFLSNLLLEKKPPEKVLNPFRLRDLIHNTFSQKANLFLLINLFK